MSTNTQKAGFISIIGKPNAGKSTLINALMGMKFAIATSKAQTTRHRIMGIVMHKGAQLVFSDTPGIIKPHYKLQEKMMGQVQESVDDADILLLLVDVNDTVLGEEVEAVLSKYKENKILLINKIDLTDQSKLEEIVNGLKEKYSFNHVLAISALHKFNTAELLDLLANHCPEHPYYFPEDQLTDRPERFFIAELIREKILTHYSQEIPYSVEIDVEEFKDKGKIIHIKATIYTERKSQKGILIGHAGLGLKRVGTEARRDIEEFVGKKVFLEMFVKVREKWRSDENQLKKFGYGQ